jgi:hypothetical protein
MDDGRRHLPPHKGAHDESIYASRDGTGAPGRPAARGRAVLPRQTDSTPDRPGARQRPDPAHHRPDRPAPQACRCAVDPRPFVRTGGRPNRSSGSARTHRRRQTRVRQSGSGRPPDPFQTQGCRRGAARLPDQPCRDGGAERWFDRGRAVSDVRWSLLIARLDALSAQAWSADASGLAVGDGESTARRRAGEGTTCQT